MSSRVIPPADAPSRNSIPISALLKVVQMYRKAYRNFNAFVETIAPRTSRSRYILYWNKRSHSVIRAEIEAY